jgi:hypothetical protein
MNGDRRTHDCDRHHVRPLLRGRRFDAGRNRPLRACCLREALISIVYWAVNDGVIWPIPLIVASGCFSRASLGPRRNGFPPSIHLDLALSAPHRSSLPTGRSHLARPHDVLGSTPQDDPSANTTLEQARRASLRDQPRRLPTWTKQPRPEPEMPCQRPPAFRDPQGNPPGWPAETGCGTKRDRRSPQAAEQSQHGPT